MLTDMPNAKMSREIFLESTLLIFLKLMAIFSMNECKYNLHIMNRYNSHKKIVKMFESKQRFKDKYIKKKMRTPETWVLQEYACT